MRLELDDEGLVRLYRHLLKSRQEVQTTAEIALAQAWLLRDVEARIQDGDIDDYLRRHVFIDESRRAACGKEGA